MLAEAKAMKSSLAAVTEILLFLRLVCGKWSSTTKFAYFFDNGIHLKTWLGEWFKNYNRERIHHPLDNLKPDEVYYNLPHPFAEAA